MLTIDELWPEPDYKKLLDDKRFTAEFDEFKASHKPPAADSIRHIRSEIRRSLYIYKDMRDSLPVFIDGSEEQEAAYRKLVADVKAAAEHVLDGNVQSGQDLSDIYCKAGIMTHSDKSDDYEYTDLGASMLDVVSAPFATDLSMAPYEVQSHIRHDGFLLDERERAASEYIAAKVSPGADENNDSMVEQFHADRISASDGSYIRSCSNPGVYFAVPNSEAKYYIMHRADGKCVSYGDSLEALVGQLPQSPAMTDKGQLYEKTYASAREEYGRDMTASEVADRFGLGCLNFSSTMPIQEQQKAATVIAYELEHIARALDVSDKCIGMNKCISISVEDKSINTFDSGAFYTYDRQTGTIGLKTAADAGSIAHEYGHAVDLLALNAEGFETTKLNKLAEYRNSSAQIQQAIGSGRNYLDNKVEMFARAFSAYVSERLDEMNIKDQLIHSSDEGLKRVRLQNGTYSAFPDGSEKKECYRQMRKLVKQLQKQHVFMPRNHVRYEAVHESMNDEQSFIDKVKSGLHL